MTYKKITSTELKQKLREKLNEVASLREPHVVYTYGEPKAVILSYEDWLEQTKQNHPSDGDELSKKRLLALEKFKFSGPKVDSTRLIREMRDNETHK